MTIIKTLFHAALWVIAIILLALCLLIKFLGLLAILPMVWDDQDRKDEGETRWEYLKGMISSGMSTSILSKIG